MPENHGRQKPSNGAVDADPFDVVTGIYSREYPDLHVDDSMPLDFVRTQRNMDPRSRAFGIGASTSYDLFIIGDAQKFSWVALVDADGSQKRYTRVTPGTGFADAVFKNTTSPTEFLGSIIFWNKHNTWTVRLLNGTEYTIQSCSPASKPGQCAVTEIKNAKGEKVAIQRDPQGNIQRITSPHQHYISVTTDAAGRITRAEDDAAHWVTYEYDPAGWLKKARTWRGEVDAFKYDAHFNMVWVGEKDKTTPAGRYRFTVTNRYDEKDRFKWQKVDFGSSSEFFAATYLEDAQGKTRQTNVRSNDGLTQHAFNADGYQVREDFVPLQGAKWSLEFTRDAATNAKTDTWLSCPARRIRVPQDISEKLEAMGDEHKAIVSRECQSLEQSRLSR
jgi:YD repeat-containing protein